MFTIYHNPRCSKSREALALLEENGVQPKVIQYLQTPPTHSELVALLSALKLPVRDLIRTKESEYQDLNLADPSLDDKVLIDAISQYPKLLERPIVVSGKKAVIGRPPENVLKLLNKK